MGEYNNSIHLTVLLQILNELIHVKHFTDRKHFKMLAIYECTCVIPPTRFKVSEEQDLCLIGILSMYYAYI